MSSWPYLHSYMENGKMNIAGVVKDFHFKPMQHAMAPMALYNFGQKTGGMLTTVGQETGAMLTTVYARIQPGGVRESMDWIRSKACELDPSLNPDDLDIHFLDETVDRLYRSEERLGRLITAAALISMLISIIGILGLVYFETQFRRKEIAVRLRRGDTADDQPLLPDDYPHLLHHDRPGIHCHHPPLGRLFPVPQPDSRVDIPSCPRPDYPHHRRHRDPVEPQCCPAQSGGLHFH